MRCRVPWAAVARTASCQRPKSPESEKGTGFGWPDTALQRPLLRLLAHLEDRHQARKLEPSQPRDGARSPTPPTIYSPAHKVTRPETNGRPQPTTAALEGRADRQEGGGRPHSPPGRAGTSPRTWSAWSWSPAAREACAASGQVWRGGQRALSCNTPPATAVPRLLLVHREPRRLRNPPPRRTSAFAGHQRATPWLPSPARLLPPGQPGSQRGAWGGARGRKAGQPGCAQVSGPAGGAAMPPSGRSENVCATQPAPPGSGPGPQEPAALAYGGGRGRGRAHVHLAITHWP